MNIFRKLVPVLSLLLIILIFELIIVFPRAYYLFLVLILILFFGIYIRSGYHFFSRHLWFCFLFPLSLMTSGYIFLYFLETEIVKQILIVSLAFFLWVILKNTSFLMATAKESQENTANIFNYLVVIAAFLFFSSFFALRIFLNIKIIWMLVFTCTIVFFLVIQVFWSNRIPFKKYWIYLAFLPLIFVELLWIITFLPTNFFVNGLFLTAIFYICLNLSRHYILGTLKSKIVVNYLIVGFVMIILTAMTAQWI